MEYPKIQTLFMRDKKGLIIPDSNTRPEFDYLRENLWECTEKIDGTNMRIEIHCDENNEVSWRYCGRTERAVIPPHLLAKMKQLFDDIDWKEIFGCLVPNTHITIFGEGYGIKIQKGGNYIKNDVSFILFDIRVGNWWLTRESCKDIAKKLNISIVPMIGMFTIDEAIDIVKRGFKSTIAENKDYDAEGLVLKTPMGLLDRGGNRIITKLKTCDFRKWEAAYGTNPMLQLENLEDGNATMLPRL